MARGRHVRRSGLLSRLRLRVGPQRRRRVAALEREVARLQELTDVTAAAASAALLRAGSASHAAVGAERRAVRAEAALAQATDEVAGLRGEMAALREELVWAFAAGAAEPRLVDLRDASSRTA